MTYAHLAPYKHHSAKIDPADLWVRTTNNALQEASVAIAKPSQVTQYGDKVLDLKKSGAGSGMWVPYQAKSAVYGYLTGNQAWAASGPYSGCYFVVGKNDGRIFAAHVSCEAANDPGKAAWDTSDLLGEILFTKKIGMAQALPVGTTNAAAIIIADISGSDVEVTRIDVKTASAGGMSGTIFAVQKLDSD